MAWYPTNIGGGSSELQETVLWTNSSPTSNFANQTVTLSDDINNYEYLKVYYRISTTNSKTIGILVSVDDFKTTASTMPLINPAGVGGNTGNPAQRYFYYASDTTMAIRDAAVGTTVYNNAAIPTAICGLKYAKPKPSGTETVLWTNSDPTSSFASQTVTLSDSAYNYRYLKVSWYGLTSNTDLRAMLVTPSDLATNTTEGSVRYALCCQSASSAQKARAISLQSANQLYFGAAVNWSGAATTMNTACIPYQIIGIS